LPITEEKAIWLDEIILANTEATVIPYDPAKTAAEGKCKYTIRMAKPVIPPHPEYPYSIDLFTQYSINITTGEIEWENPYGGLGYSQASDTFPPQALVNLFAYVSYYGDAVVGKPVSFELVGPQETHYTALVLTDARGIANLTYVLPWDVEGVWAATATVALGGKQISDRLSFREDWLIKAFVVDIIGMTSKTELLSAEVLRGNVLDKTEKRYQKGEDLTMAVDLRVTTMQNPRVCMQKIYGGQQDMWLKVTIFDDLMQPVATSKFNVNDLIKDAPYENRVDFERTIEDLISFGATIKHNAFSGPAHVCFNVFTNDPGLPYCPQTEVLVWIYKGT
jgi:hypothetical protein